jgi:hypothetical protein
MKSKMKSEVTTGSIRAKEKAEGNRLRDWTPFQLDGYRASVSGHIT